jgi:hypothetical protein
MSELQENTTSNKHTMDDDDRKLLDTHGPQFQKELDLTFVLLILTQAEIWTDENQEAIKIVMLRI